MTPMKRRITAAELSELRALCARGSALCDQLTALEDAAAALLGINLESDIYEHDFVVDAVWNGKVDRLLDHLGVRVREGRQGREVGT